MVMPLDLLETLLNKQVTLLLKDGRRLKGQLAGFDPHMNLVLDEAEETRRDDEGRRTLGTLVLRGNNVVSIAPT